MGQEIIDKYWADIYRSKKEEKKKMATLKEEAMAYEPKQTLNIADLPEVSVNLELFDGEGTDKNGDMFKYKYTKLEGKDYRVPVTVLEEIQKILKLKPEVEKVKVTKTGSGMATKYSVDVI
jgi:hypothetical protein|tara:strand:- start:45 stop:407 length:363 start_codon:yes stop_codon:yes gene_type:complete